MSQPLSYLLDGVIGVQSGFEDQQISEMTLDSRAVIGGYLFVAMNGSQEHGLKYAQKAEQSGAVAVIWEYVDGIDVPELSIPLIAIKNLPASLGGIAARLYDYSNQPLQIVGITGTDGKTSVSHFLAQAMNASGGSCAVIGTLGIGNPNALEKATHTTPDVISVHKNLQRLSQRGSRCVAMEVSSHALDQQRVAGVNFDVAILTNLTRDHLDYHGTVEAYAEAKAKLFLEHRPKSAVLNLNDDFGLLLAEKLSGSDVTVVPYVIGDASDYTETTLVASSANYNHRGLSAVVSYKNQNYSLGASVLGDFNLSNLMATLGAMISLGYDIDVAIDAVTKVATVSGRIERVALNEHQDFLTVADYAHTPGALESVLSALRVHCSAKLICVFGCGGDRDAGKRPLMAAVAERLADVVIVTDDNPRTENPVDIMSDITAGFEHPEAVIIEHDRSAAIKLAVQQANTGDVVLIAGKGHEQAQLIGGVEYPFDDREQIRQALATMEAAA
ncbi:UDP-N-acetylmuramoyl-L-alanyl-D-glutamate--2,6-diaminopimelate ligase [Leucothrix pacifica]|uniref:UDP-N-acetylmuramoyl-L-alanyl-D-glutamate--2,6-diaminopimelate ligase n=1 Tax=Leucothrix pacifica TaxID=1247513 RepID=A0A317CBN4_9GAMM|nr:UDP-N-acetylmuramoyl-L-alanyl-D-glutamate--2,6-diaminopimelate ligase [Leucothrix pacifica]PWQ95779.1 UDP-N-acetylmuramoyl-L-alanyl-D-glutamate--2,6-diaminopimelate ligase [Leucothrix pacifica]